MIIKHTRRSFFHSVAGGIYGAALADLFARDLFADSPSTTPRVFDLRPKTPKHRARAKAVIQLFQNGGPSQVDLFDPKPALERHHGQSIYADIAPNVSSPEQAGGLMRSPYKFAQHGKSGIWLSEVMPHLTQIVDDIAVIRSMYNTHPNHEPALYKIHSGQMLPGLPALGAWVTYGLGTVNQNLPAYIVLDDPLGLPVNGVQSWQSGYLPPLYQGTRLRSTGSPLLNLHAEVQQPSEVSRLQQDLLGRLDRIHQRERPYQLQLDARIASYELAARMQMEATDALDLNQESQATLDRYGVGKQPTDSYARRCLMARRLVERGVRYVQIFINAQIWDNHNRLPSSLRAACERTDQPVAALVQDLKQRGLLEDTLVIWGGEFGRLPIAQMQNGDLANAGRDHGPAGFSLWMAGGGIKGGTVYGATDEIGYAAAENRVSVADWHATILHLLGMHHNELFFERNGFRDKLTGTQEVHIVRDIIQ
jgi:hypothetical protein